MLLLLVVVRRRGAGGWQREGHSGHGGGEHAADRGGCRCSGEGAHQAAHHQQAGGAEVVGEVALASQQHREGDPAPVVVGAGARQKHLLARVYYSRRLLLCA